MRRMFHDLGSEEKLVIKSHFAQHEQQKRYEGIQTATSSERNNVNSGIASSRRMIHEHRSEKKLIIKSCCAKHQQQKGYKGTNMTTSSENKAELPQCVHAGHVS